MRMRFSAAAGAALILMGWAGMAEADIVTMRYTGQITHVDMPLDPFGIPDINGPLAQSLGYVFDLKFDTSIGTLLSDPFNSILLGLQTNPTIRSWKLTINGVTDAGQFDPGELYNNEVGRTGGPASGQVSALLDGGLFNVEYWGVTIGASSTAANTPNFTDPFVAQNVTGGARFNHYLQSGGVFSHLYQIRGTVTDVSIVQAGVPEPATWAMMIVGFGGAGAMLRRRRQALA